ncbi:hypothetical protein BRD00_07430 [Halobacteriales archaeon QS_8_69_26]|nr:MAG: hypothetical protein BRD00_07430 [Halobacteriales archaeon QS_8_69_26]
MTGLRLTVENVGGIESTEVEFGEGITLVTGTNASNKTSLLRAIQFAFGVDSVPIHTDADTATVEMEFEGKHVSRTARHRSGDVAVEGQGWIEDPDDVALFERFGALLETNPLRTAVGGSGDIERLLTEPMNVDALRREQSRKMEEKRELQSRLEDLSDVDERLEECREERSELRERRETLEERLDGLYERRSESGEDGDHEELLERRADLVAERESHADQVERLESAVDRLDERLEEVRSELATVRETADSDDLDHLQSRRSDLRADVREREKRIEVLQSALTANREMLESGALGALGYEAGLDDDRITCWTCGQEAPSADFEETAEELAELVASEKERKDEHEPELERIEERIEAAERARRRVDELEAKLRSIQENRESRLESLERRRDQLEAVREEMADLNERIEERSSERDSEQADLNERIEETRVRITRLEREIASVDEECDTLEDRLEKRERTRDRLETVTTEIRELTEQIENIEDHLRDEFNEAMDDLVAMLSFDRIERVWLDGSFDLVIAREFDGNVQRDVPEHLSESEREMVGLVACLAGYLTYDVGSVAPVLVIDSLGAFDAERTERLVEYFGEKTDLVLAAVHPEKAADAEFETRSDHMPASGPP